ncbi:MAG: hypothetical protein JWO05_1789 [Gemmatimonadetes bacterium]|nr:hypothetical protein [Gemmatimonadota bacterium]
MRFNGLVLAASAIVLGACGGGEKAATTDTAATAAPTPAATATTPATAPATGAAAAAPATGATHDVKMVMDAKGYHFDPADITIKAGDAIRWTMVSGGPHNVAFDGATLPADAKGQIDANMPEKMMELSGKMLLAANETYTISFANVKAGKYDYHCTPHLAMGMKGTITVQ